MEDAVSHYNISYNGISDISQEVPYMFEAPPLPEGTLFGIVAVTVSAVNAFGPGPPSNVSKARIGEYIAFYSVFVFVHYSFGHEKLFSICKLHFSFLAKSVSLLTS